MSETKRMTDEEFEAAIRCRQAGELDATLAVDREARRARASEAESLEALAAVMALHPDACEGRCHMFCTCAYGRARAVIAKAEGR